MAGMRVSLVVSVTLLFLFIALPTTQAASAPAAGPTSEGTSIDQGVAYVLMLFALALTYLIHAADFSYCI